VTIVAISRNSFLTSSFAFAFAVAGQSIALVIVEAEPPSSQSPVLLPEVIDHLQLALVHPPGDSDRHEPKWTKTLGIFALADYRESRGEPIKKSDGAESGFPTIRE
jgi:hypothetical protein